jgi:hypothetical protein
VFHRYLISSALANVNGVDVDSPAPSCITTMAAPDVPGVALATTPGIVLVMVMVLVAGAEQKTRKRH